MVIGIVVSLILLMWIAYRGYNVIFFAPFLGLFAAVTAGYPVFPTYTEIFMPALANYAKTYFPIFILGAVFGKVMEESGAARSIAHWIIKSLGTNRAVLSVALSAAVLTYGGVSLFVVAFAVYPFAASLYKEADIPKRLIPASIGIGAFTFTMTMLPGTPQIQNLIPVKYFNTDAYAAPIIGLLAAVIMFAAGVLWVEYRRKSLQAKGENYGSMHNFINEPSNDQFDEASAINPALALLPLICVLVLNYVFTNMMKAWDQTAIVAIPALKATNVVSSSPIWALVAALVIGIVLTIIIGWKNLRTEANVIKAVNAGAIGSLLAIMNTASETGYGNIIKSLPGFKSIASALLSIDPGTPLVSEAIAVNVLAGITGSASGGMSIALEAMSQRYLEWASQVGVDPQMLHRIASIASGGMDSLPHNGAVITTFAICGLTHKAAYPDLCMITVIMPFIVGFLMIGIYTFTGIM